MRFATGHAIAPLRDLPNSSELILMYKLARREFQYFEAHEPAFGVFERNEECKLAMCYEWTPTAPGRQTAMTDQ
jgi:hypothetical protein